MLVEALQVLLYVALIVLVISLIVFIIKLIGSLSKIDYLVENITRKAESLDAVFDMIDITTSKLGSFGDMITSGITNVIGKLFVKKSKKRKGEINE